MKVTVFSATGLPTSATLNRESGVIEFEGGELSHILFEKQFNKRIVVYQEPKEEVSLVPSEEQSDPRPAKKTKRK